MMKHVKAVVRKESVRNDHSRKKTRVTHGHLIDHSNDNSPTQNPLNIQRKKMCPCDGSCPRCTTIQAKLKIGTPGDVYENQADQIADQVVHMPDRAIQMQPMEEEEEMLQPKLLPGQTSPILQMQPMEEEEEMLQPKLLPGQSIPILQMQPMEEEEEMLQPKLLPGQSTPILQMQPMEEEEEMLQPKLLPGQSTPILQMQPMEEEEEELQAKLLPGQPSSILQMQPMEEEEEEMQTKLLPGQSTPILQMQPMEEEEEMLQPKSAYHSPNPVHDHDSIQDRIHEMRGGGQPLSSSDRSYFEPRLGNDLSDVRVHTGEHASDLAQGMQARAFTVGHDIAFNRGQYDPSSMEGKKLMAHELVHVAQQTGVNPSSDPMIQRYPDQSARDIQGEVTVLWGDPAPFRRRTARAIQQPPLNIPALVWRHVFARSNLAEAYRSLEGLMWSVRDDPRGRRFLRMGVEFHSTGTERGSTLSFRAIEPSVRLPSILSEPTETPTSGTEEAAPATPPPAAPPTPRPRTGPGEDIANIMVLIRRREPRRRLDLVLADVSLMLSRWPSRPREADRVNLHRFLRAMLDSAPRDRRREVGEFIRTSLRDDAIDIIRTAVTPINRGTLTLLGITPAAGGTSRDWTISGNTINIERPISCISSNGSLYRSNRLRVGMTTFLSHHNNIGRAVVIRSISATSIGVRIYNFDEATGRLRDVQVTSWGRQELGTQISLQTLSGLRVWQPIATVVAIVSIVILTAGTSSIVGAGAATAAELGISSGAHLLLTAVQAGLVAGITNFIHRHQADMMRGAQQGNAGRFWELPQYSFETHMRNFLYDFITGTASSYIGRMGSTGPSGEFGRTMWRQIARSDQARLIVAFILRRLQEALTSVVGGLVGLGRDLYNARNQAARDRAVRSFRQTVIRAFTVDVIRGMVSNTLR